MNNENQFEEAELESEVNSSENEIINQNLGKKKSRLKKHRGPIEEEELELNDEESLIQIDYENDNDIQNDDKNLEKKRRNKDRNNKYTAENELENGK